MSILNPKEDAAAIQPLVDKAVAQAIAGLANQVAPAVGAAIQSAIDGVTITISISRKERS